MAIPQAPQREFSVMRAAMWFVGTLLAVAAVSIALPSLQAAVYSIAP